MTQVRENKNTSVKKLVFITTSVFLLFDVLFLPFVTEPFVFEDGVITDYITGSILTLAIWLYVVWSNFAKHKKTKLFRYENSVLFGDHSSDEKRRYYLHLNLALNLVTAALIGLIFFGFFSVITQADLFLSNFKTFLGS